MGFSNKTSLLTLGGLALTTALSTLSLQVQAQAVPQAWTDGTTEYSDSGVNAVVTTPDANNTYINQTGQLTIYSTPNSNVGLGETVTIGQDNTSSHFVMKADNGAEVTSILGSILTRLKDSSGNATSAIGGLLTILDTNGVYFGANSFIDAAAVVASTGTLNERKLIRDGVFELKNFVAGTSVEIETGAVISVADSGLAAFVAPTVTNRGTITANLGRVELAGVNTKTTVDLYGDNLVEFAIDKKNTDALNVLDSGTINADGGIIHMTTGAASNLIDSVVNTSGIKRVSSVTQQGGKIILGGAQTKTVIVDGELNANGQTDGGSIEVNALETIDLAATSNITATGTTGETGVFALNTETATLNSGTNTVLANTLDNGTNVGVNATRDVMVEANLQWTGTGLLDLDAKRNIVLMSEIRSENIDQGDAIAVNMNAGRDIRVDKTNGRVYVLVDSGDVSMTSVRHMVLGDKNTGATLIQLNKGDLDLNVGKNLMIRNRNAATSVNAINGNITVNVAGTMDMRAGNAAKQSAVMQSLSGDVSINASDIKLVDGRDGSEAYILADNIQLGRSTDGSIGIGDQIGDMTLSQSELDALRTSNLTIGQTNSDDSKVTDILVENGNFATFDNVALNALALSQDDGSSVTFTGANIFNAIETAAGDDITVDGSVSAAGSVSMDARDIIDVNAAIGGASIALNADKIELNGALNTALLTGSANVVDVETNIVKIADGVNLVNAGGIVNVGADTFNENVVVDKSINLYGAQKGVDARNRSGVSETIIIPNSPAFDVTADDVVIDGFTIAGGHPAVQVTNADNVTISNNIMSDQIAPGNSDDGIFLLNATNVTIDQNWIQNSGDEGIFARGDLDGLMITNNLIDDAKNNAIEIKNGNGIITIDNNTVNRAGLNGIFINNTDNVIVKNNVVNNDASTDYGIQVRLSDATQITNNKVNNGPVGILVDGGNGSMVLGNTIQSFTETGIEISQANNTDIMGNIISSRNAGSVGVFVDGSTNTDIGDFRRANVIRNVDTGILLSGDNKTKMKANSFSNNDTSILADNNGGFTSQNLDIINNRFNGGEYAIRLLGAQNVDMGDRNGGNQISNYETAVTVNGGSNIAIDNNAMTNVDNGIVADNVALLNIEDNVIDGRSSRFGKGDSGISVTNSDGAKIGGINDGNVIQDFETGISVQNSEKVDVSYNTVTEFVDYGIYADNSKKIDITNNIINGALNAFIPLSVGDEGIYITNSNKADIKHNTVSFVSDDAIDVNDSNRVDVNRNTVFAFGDDGIDIDNSHNADVNRNDIAFGRDNGIQITNSDNATLSKNDIVFVGANGIDVYNGSDIVIEDNKVRLVQGNGIKVASASGVDILENTINNTGDDGVDVEKVKSIKINRNTITNAGDDAIDLENSDNVKIKRNVVSGSGDNDIDVYKTDDVVIKKNTLSKATNNGIYVLKSDDVSIVKNTISDSGENGVFVKKTDGVEIELNVIDNAGRHGIKTRNSDDVVLTSNSVSNAANNGIVVSGGDNAQIALNDVTGSGRNGIKVRDTDNASITSNASNGNGRSGVVVSGATNTDVIDNTVDGNNVGITVRGFAPLSTSSNNLPSDQTLIANNVITNNTTAGIRTQGDAVGLVGLSGNDLNANTIGFLLEGGEIDLTNLAESNSIIGGETGMRFIGDNVSLTRNTLGSTIFEGQSGNFIELQDGALFNPGTPTIIDGLSASWDGIIPLNSLIAPGVLSAVDRLAIENRIVDFDDNTTLGQILVGLTPDLSEEDIFALGLFSLSPDAGNVNVVFRGLPPVSAPSIAALVNLEPAAGEGTSPEDLANLEPAAGATEGCWASAVTGAGNYDGNVSYQFGGDIQNAIADSSCGGSNI